MVVMMRRGATRNPNFLLLRSIKNSLPKALIQRKGEKMPGVVG